MLKIMLLDFIYSNFRENMIVMVSKYFGLILKQLGGLLQNYLRKNSN